MTIIWCGGEDIDFYRNSMVITTTSGYYRSDYARCGMAGGMAVSTPFSAITSGWAHRYTANRSTSATWNLMGLVKGVEDYRGIYVRVTNSPANYNFLITKCAGADGTSSHTTLAATTNAPYVGSGSLDLQVDNYSSNGTVRLYFRGMLILEYTGDITISGVSDFTCMMIASNASDKDVASECIVADVDTRLMSVKTMHPSQNESSSGWTGSYTDIDETTESLSDTVHTNASGSTYQCGLGDMPAYGTFTVEAVKMAARVADGTGSTDIKIGIKTNSTVYLGSAQTLDNYWINLIHLLQTNPNTGVAFTPAEITALQFAMESV